MVLIPKTKITQPILNPFRPKIGIPSKHTICRLSWGHYFIEPDEMIDRIRVDADHNEEFIAAMEAQIPKKERYRCHDREIWLVDAKHKSLLVQLAKENFEEVVTQLRTWE